MTITDAEIATRTHSGELLDDISHQDSDIDDPNSLLNRCITLHNSQRIDLLSLTKTEAFNSLDASGYFERQHFFCQAIPRLETKPEPLMEAVELLVSKGGNDLAANLPNEAFHSWCATKPARADAVISGARSGDPLAIRFVALALAALGNTELAQSFVREFTDTRRSSGMFALSRIKPMDLIDAETSINVLLPYLDAKNDEASRSNSLVAVLEICRHFTALAPVYLPKAIVAAAEEPTQGMLFRLAQVLWDHVQRFDRFSIGTALAALKATDPSLKGITQGLDLALDRILGTSNGDLAQDFLTEVLASKKHFDLELFPITVRNIAAGDRNRLFTLVVLWLTSNNSNLEAATPKILRGGERDTPFDTSTEALGLDGPSHIFLAHKAIGWLFMKSVVAASLLVACLRGCDRKTATIIRALLFDPLLVNFGGSARDYLKSIKRRDRAYSSVKKALEEYDNYIANLKVEPAIKELRPSEYQRGVVRRHEQDWMQEIQKGAEKQSIFMNLVHRTIILYGRRSTTFLREPGGKRRPVSMDLRSFSHSFELPRSEIIDPVGLNMMLLAYRNAKKP